MSRRHHGSRPHRPIGPQGPADSNRSSFDAPAAADLGDRTDRPAAVQAPSDGHPAHDSPRLVRGFEPAVQEAGSREIASSQLNAELPRTTAHGAPPPGPNEPERTADGLRRLPHDANGAGGPDPASCTAPQLRRFIKSRPYVPMHELRRRFGINGSEDDVSSIDLGDHHHVYVGLPPREGSLLGELLRGGDIGYELSLDPRTPVVIGLYPMRPVARS
ncbi:MAG: hypothetical protein ABIZ72_09430 [Candidatus Limnocylindrales bacterium]